MEIKAVSPAIPDSYEHVYHETGLKRSCPAIYFQAVLPEQFDEYIWFDETNGDHALRDEDAGGPARHLHSGFERRSRRGSMLFA
jgi:hypothetical protein